MDIRVTFLLILEALLALWLLYRSGLLTTRRAVIVSVVLTAAAFFLRYLCLDYQTLDYIDFLSRWVQFYRELGGFAALDASVGNYNIPYLYFLAAFSYSGISDLYLIKLLSILFDVLLAYSAMRLVGTVTDRHVPKLVCFFAVLFLPTVILNGALWAQCDSIYVALGLTALWLAMEKRPVASMVCLALSFGFKLQAVFIIPVFAVLWMRGDLKLWHFLLFPLTYILLVLPAVLLGRPFADTVLLYFDQAGSIGSGLNYNSPSVFAFFRSVANEELAAKLGIAAAFLFMLAVLLLCSVGNRRLSDRGILAAALLLAVGIPFLLPHMHDRYFFAADILSVVLACALPACIPAAVLTQFASLLGYHAYLKMRYLLPMKDGSVALLGVLLIALAVLISELRKIFFKFDEKTY